VAGDSGWRQLLRPLSQPVELPHVGVEDGGDVGDEGALLRGTKGVWIGQLDLDPPLGEAGFQYVDPEAGQSIGIGDDHPVALPPTHRPDQSVEPLAGIVHPAADVRELADQLVPVGVAEAPELL